MDHILSANSDAPPPVGPRAESSEIRSISLWARYIMRKRICLALTLLPLLRAFCRCAWWKKRIGFEWSDATSRPHVTQPQAKNVSFRSEGSGNA